MQKSTHRLENSYSLLAAHLPTQTLMGQDLGAVMAEKTVSVRFAAGDKEMKFEGSMILKSQKDRLEEWAQAFAQTARV